MSIFNPPPAPNPQTGIQLGQQVAGQQQDFNRNAAVESQAGSAVNQYNPFGSLEYTQSGVGPNGVPLYSATTNLSPQQQQLFDLLQGTKTTAGQQGQALLSGANYGGQSPSDVIGNMTKGTTADLLKTQTDYYQPFFTTERSQLDTQLRNQGLNPGQPGYDNAMRQLDTNHSLAVTKAAGEFEPQAFQQASSLYNLPATLGTSLASFGQPGDPKSMFNATPGLNEQPANLTGATANENSALNSQYAAQQQQYQNMMSGIFGIPTAALGGWAKGGFPGASSLFGSGSSLGAGEAAGVGAGVDASMAGMGDMAALLAV